MTNITLDPGPAALPPERLTAAWSAQLPDRAMTAFMASRMTPRFSYLVTEFGSVVVSRIRPVAVTAWCDDCERTWPNLKGRHLGALESHADLWGHIVQVEWTTGFQLRGRRRRPKKAQ